MQLRDQVGGGDVKTAIGGVGAGGDGGGVSGPHGGAAGDGGEEGGIFVPGFFEDLSVGAGETEGAKGGDVGAELGWEDGLRDAEIGEEFHLGQAFEGGLAGVGSGGF